MPSDTEKLVASNLTIAYYAAQPARIAEHLQSQSTRSRIYKQPPVTTETIMIIYQEFLNKLSEPEGVGG